MINKGIQSFIIDPDLNKEFKEFCKDTGINFNKTKRVLLEDAILDLMRRGVKLQIVKEASSDKTR